ncbi:MAG: DUF2508 family protein [Ruminiclostridium sp.]|nr:DUF2508 family protein [Ruminiclostridium sp.]
MESESRLILEELERVKAMLYKNEQLFDLAVADADIESLIYERKALHIRYSALTARAKELGIKREVTKCMK